MNELTRSQLESLAALGGSRELLKTAAGAMDAYRFAPVAGPAGLPIIFYCDAGGTRPSQFTLARRLAGLGHEVLMPNLYHRQGSYAPFDAATVFSDPDERARLQTLAASLTAAGIASDTAACLAALPAGPVGALGYCLGGGQALSAAGNFPQRVAAAASIHGGSLATDAPASPHRLAPRIKARLYIGVAGIDPYFTPDEAVRLRAALDAAGADYRLEVYPEARHGFAVPDMPVYDPIHAEIHWQRLESFFAQV